MKLRLLTLLVLCLAMATAAAVPAGAQVSVTFSLAEAYPCAAGTYEASLGITDPQVFTGTCPAQMAAPGAVPGILSLQRRGTVLDVNCFAMIPSGQVGPCFVQSFRLTKVVPGSIKCPDVYGSSAHTYFQFGAGVRTWWSLNFTQPGTRFTLEVVSVCRTPSSTGIGDPRLHRDTWSWQVVADVNTLAPLIELMHSGAVSTLEVPCIIGEDMYEALKGARERLAIAVAGKKLTEIGNAIFDFEGLIVANCLFTEVLNPLEAFPGPNQFGAPGFQPPGNLAPTVSLDGQGTAVAGIIDTTEHPCCCKLLVDLEWIAVQTGVNGPTGVSAPTGVSGT